MHTPEYIYKDSHGNSRRLGSIPKGCRGTLESYERCVLECGYMRRPINKEHDK